MSDEQDPRDELEEVSPGDVSPDPALERALGELPAPRARPAFRAELRERFVSGDFAAGFEDAAGAEPEDEGLWEPERVPRPAARERRRLWGAVALIAASVALLVVFRPWERGDAPPGDVVVDGGAPTGGAPTGGAPTGGADPREVETPAPAPVPAVATWQVVGEVGRVRVDGVDLADAAAVDAALARAGAAGRVEALEGALRLRLADHVLIEAAETTRFALGAAPRQPAELALGVDTGVLRVCTGPGFPGSSLALRTPEADVAVVGTAFAVDLYDAGTCVCCTEGTVDVALRDPATGEGGAVEAGGMLFAFSDRLKACATGPAMADHTDPLRALEAAAKGLW